MRAVSGSLKWGSRRMNQSAQGFRVGGGRGPTRLRRCMRAISPAATPQPRQKGHPQQRSNNTAAASSEAAARSSAQADHRPSNVALRLEVLL